MPPNARGSHERTRANRPTRKRDSPASAPTDALLSKQDSHVEVLDAAPHPYQENFLNSLQSWVHIAEVHQPWSGGDTFEDTFPQFDFEPPQDRSLAHTFVQVCAQSNHGSASNSDQGYEAIVLTSELDSTSVLADSSQACPSFGETIRDSSSSSSLVILTPPGGSRSGSTSSGINSGDVAPTDSVLATQLDQDAARYGGPLSNSWALPPWVRYISLSVARLNVPLIVLRGNAKERAQIRSRPASGATEIQMSSPVVERLMMRQAQKRQLLGDFVLASDAEYTRFAYARYKFAKTWLTWSSAR